MGSVGAALLRGAILAAAAGPAFAACAPGVVEVRGTAGIARFSVEVADDAAERAQGLMQREKMAASSGMLFVYEAPQRAVFWMKDTLIALDMIFIDSAGRVTAVHPNAVPLDETPIDGGPGVTLVLEIRGGLASRLGIAPGAEIRHPAIAQKSAAWPCADE